MKDFTVNMLDVCIKNPSLLVCVSESFGFFSTDLQAHTRTAPSSELLIDLIM